MLRSNVLHVLETIFSIVSFSILLIYFDVVSYVTMINSNHYQYISKGVWMFVIAILVYLLNYFRYVIHPKASNKITQERWYTVSPISVWVIFSCFFLSFVYFVIGLWPKFHLLSFIITLLGVVVLFNIVNLF